MATFPKKKKKGAGPLGNVTPPTVTEIKNNLSEPEHAPSNISAHNKKVRVKSKRIVPFTTKITPDFDTDLRQIAFDHKKTLGEVLELAFYSWKKENKL